MPELEETKTDTTHKQVRRWSDREVREVHRQQGKDWRSVHPDTIETLKPTSKNYANEYERIFKHR